MPMGCQTERYGTTALLPFVAQNNTTKTVIFAKSRQRMKKPLL
jgi:hypothetical protein